MGYSDGLKTPLEIKKNTGSTKDAGGQIVSSLETVATALGRICATRASVETEGGQMSIGHGQVTIQINLATIDPPDFEITGNMQISADGHNYNLQSAPRVVHGAGASVHHLTADARLYR